MTHAPCVRTSQANIPHGMLLTPLSSLIKSRKASFIFYLLSKIMASHNLLGQIGEEEACRFLIRKGYTLLERNWRVGHLELDIIAECYGEIIFVEVKTRSNEDFAPAITAVDDEKIKNLRLAARHYLDLNRLDQPIRFDIITVVGEQRPFTITHYVGGS